MGKIRRIARQEGVDPRLLRALIHQESGNNPGARSPVGAIGRTQLMPATARGLGVDPYNDDDNIRGGARYLRQQLKTFGGDVRKALAAYNAGPGAVQKYGGVPPFAETQHYVDSILSHYHGGAPPGASTPSQPTMAVPSSVELRRQHVFDAAGYEQATQRARVGDFLRSQGKGNSILFRSGLFGGATPSREDFTSTRLRSKLIPGVAGSSSDVARSPSDAGLPSGQVGTAISQARAKLGIAEIGTSNTGPKIDRWERSFGMVGAPWCGIFLGTVLRQAGVRGIDSRIASVSSIEQMARARQGPYAGWVSPSAAAAGDALVTAKGQHVVFVTGRSGNIIHTIGGNSGGRVQRVDYRADQVYGAARIRYAR